MNEGQMAKVERANRKRAEQEGTPFGVQHESRPRSHVPANPLALMRMENKKLKADCEFLRETNQKLESSLSFLSREMNKLEQENKKLKAKKSVKKKATK